jgi:chorismate synthase
VTLADVAAFDVQCPDPAAAPAMAALIDEVRLARDTIGGVIGVVARNVPAGLGEPVFDKLEADLGKALLSLPAAKGFESGSGFAGARLRGSAHMDPFTLAEGGRAGPGATVAPGAVRTTSNRAGGIQGGISNGMPILARVAFKPVATHFLPQPTIDEDGVPVTLVAKGRHDPCVLPRAVVIVEAMTALVLADHALRQRASRLTP